MPKRAPPKGSRKPPKKAARKKTQNQFRTVKYDPKFAGSAGVDIRGAFRL